MKCVVAVLQHQIWADACACWRAVALQRPAEGGGVRMHALCSVVPRAQPTRANSPKSREPVVAVMIEWYWVTRVRRLPLSLYQVPFLTCTWGGWIGRCDSGR